jgi:predicted hydrocarbon binding protein
MTYMFDKEMHEKSLEAMPEAPWRIKLMLKLLMPKNFSSIKDMRKMASYLVKNIEGTGVGLWEYLQKDSKSDEHYFRIYESSLCWPFENVGARLGFFGPGAVAGMLKAFEKEHRDWNVIETCCMGTGEQYCELKMVPEETPELKDFLESIDNTVVEKVHERLINHFMNFVTEGKPLPERPRLGSGVAFNQMFLVSSLPSLASDRYRMAIRMGGARTGKEIGERLLEAGLEEDEIINRVINFMRHCKVGKIELSETIRIKENCESFGLETGELNCFFTTGFLNGLYSAVKNKHVREIKCAAAGDPYCEWEII